MKRFVFGGIMGVALLGSGACSGTTVEEKGGVTCGEGTELVDGKCVVKAGGVDASAAIPDAGGAVSVVDAAADAGTASVFDAGSDAATSSGDPCPPKDAIVNCSNTCGGTTANCTQVSCPLPATTYVANADGSSLGPWYIRTPDKPGANAACEAMCKSAGTKPAYVMRISVAYTDTVFVRVGAPWHILLGESCVSNYPVPSIVYDHCAFLTSASFVVWTDDPNAPART